MELPNTVAQSEGPSPCQPAASRLQQRTQHASCLGPALRANSSWIRRCQTAGTVSVLPLAVGSARHFPWPESEGHPGAGMGLGLGSGRGDDMSVAAADGRLRWPWGNRCPPGCPKPADKRTWPGPTPGSEPRTLGSLLRPPPRRERWGRRMQEPTPLPSLALGSCSLSQALMTRLDRPGAGVLQPAAPVAPLCFCLHPGPNHNLQHLDSSASRGPKPDRDGKETSGR